MDELTREFLIESQEGLDRMERCLTELESRPDDTALLADIFRSVHTIKGTTGFLGFKRLEKLAHAGENLLGLLRDGKLVAKPHIITGLLELLDGLRSILSNIEADGGEVDVEDAELIARLEELQEPDEEPQPEELSAALTSTQVQNPLLMAMAQEQKQAVVQKKATAEAVARPRPVPQAAPASGSEPAKGAAAVTTATSAAESTLRVDVALLNRMMNLVGELVLTRNQVLQATAADSKMTLLTRRLDMVTADLRESVMKARMQPVSNIFSKMPRIVRDVSQLLGRKVRLEMNGQETELDKSLLEAIKDPLTHAVRNSLDHGIEPPEVRVAAGKNAEGTLKLRAGQQGSHVIVEVSDDGAGISAEKVRKKAIERGLITLEAAAQLPDRELLNLIFLPGFSTATAVTSVSGRGVGMDVVKTNVEKIGGEVEIESRLGKGTTLRLRIPLTLAIIPALIVRSLDKSFAVPQGALSELVHLSTEQAVEAIEWIENAPLYRLRGQLLPLVFLDRMLMADTRGQSREVGDIFVAVLDADGRRYGLVVDGLADPEEIVVKPLSHVLKDIGLYSGATVLGNGDLALILDPGAIAARAGVAMRAEEQIKMGDAVVEAEEAQGNEYLLVEVAGRRAAVRLADVLRIEQVSASRVEYIGVRPVLHFDGQLLAVEDAGGILAEARGEMQVIVVVCREAGRQIGVAVSHVLDVAAGSDLIEAGTAQAASGVTLLKDRVTGIVDLGSVSMLPLPEAASEACVENAQ
ncbi:chemotaxis protein CheA [Terracidiphilus gabretensis]|uniref:chemotaxis protein CheA n=1 Tax=Terracidiphilus gabretensis TaxID=1577687 RepID=UPI00071B3DE1|nr:chemotaxis protein CheA [Terracidiphilus gabretensis]